MKKTTTLLTSLLLLSALGLAGCGAKSSNSSQPNATTPSVSEQTTYSDEALKVGTAKLLRTAKKLGKAITAGDEAKVKELGPQLEEDWSAFEDGIKPKYPDLYEQVEKYLDPAIAGTEASPLNKEALQKLDNQLIDVLYDLSQELIPLDKVKTGATEMIALTVELKKGLKNGDEAKIKEIGPKLEEAWSTFEDGVRPLNADLYEKIEKSLNPEVAGTQHSPIDEKILTQLNDSLAQALNELLRL